MSPRICLQEKNNLNQIERLSENCVGLGGCYYENIKKMVAPQEELQFLEENENDSTINNRTTIVTTKNFL